MFFSKKKKWYLEFEGIIRILSNMMFRLRQNIEFSKVNKNSKTRYNLSRLTCKI